MFNHIVQLAPSPAGCYIRKTKEKRALVYVDRRVIEPVEKTFGVPDEISLTQEVHPDELAMVRRSRRGIRSHDVTFFIFGPSERVVLIRKHHFPPGAFRIPSGGLKPGEDFVTGLLREACEETGLSVEPRLYLLRVHVTFFAAQDPDKEPWTTHVVVTTARDASEPRPLDTAEIESARYGTIAELQGPIRAILLASGSGLFRYRVRLTDAAVFRLRQRGIVAGL